MSNVFVCPWAGAFRAGRIFLGISMVMMQLSLVLWPVAVCCARKLSCAARVQALLDEISVNYAGQPCEKRFVAGVDLKGEKVA